jgi:ZIP family zinc transporter
MGGHVRGGGLSTSGEAAVPAVEPGRRPRVWLALVPLALIGITTALLVTIGPRGIFPGNFPPVEELDVTRVTLRPDHIDLVVTNGGASPVTIAQTTVDDALWDHTIEPSPTIKRLGSARVSIPYQWVAGEPLKLGLVTSTGLTFEHDVAVATESPTVDARFLLTFLVLGLYIGVVPVLLGMTWRPFLRTLPRRWLHFFMAMTAGILAFLGVEALADAIEKSGQLPSALGGIGVVTLGALGSFAVILAGSRSMQARQARRGGGSRLVVATAVAAGIGLHNLGEGLAVGAAYRLGEIALGAFLVIGFALHNTTEGLGIVSILGDAAVSRKKLLALGLLAGGPTIIGTWVGAFFFSPLLATVFLAVAAGAIAEVIVDVMRVVRREAPGGLTSVESLAGIAIGLVVMYATGLLVAA